MLLRARWCLSIIAKSDFIFRVYSEILHIACFEAIDDRSFYNHSKDDRFRTILNI